jgi:hypothetical protein
MSYNKKTNRNRPEKRPLKETHNMGKAIATVVLVAAVLVLISLTIFSSDGTFGDAKVQRDRASAHSTRITVPSTLP